MRDEIDARRETLLMHLVSSIPEEIQELPRHDSCARTLMQPSQATGDCLSRTICSRFHRPLYAATLRR